MKQIYVFILSMLCICSGVCSACEHVDATSGRIYHSVYHKRYKSDYVYNRKCWMIAVPENSYIQLQLITKDLGKMECTERYIIIKVAETEQEHVFCPQDTTWNPVKAKSNVTIENYSFGNAYSNFEISYNIESLICESEEHFRCSSHTCISSNQTCDGIKDCENGKDETGCGSRICNLNKHFRCSEDNCIPETQVCDGREDCENGSDEIGCGFEIPLKGVRTSRESAIAWLKNRRSTSFGWGVNTHRAVTALYLSGGINFEDGNLEGELMAQQLELQTAIALLRNSSSILSVNELSMFINALTVSCHNPRQFYGNDIVKILERRIDAAKSAAPGAYLTLCNANWEYSETRITRVLSFLNMHTGYPFERDIQAMTVMALACIKSKTNTFDKVTNATEMYNATIEDFIASQQPSGSFGNVHTTALVAQALLSCGPEYTKAWNVTATVNYLMTKLNFSEPDFLTTTLVLPVLNSKSLIDVGYRNCNKQKKHTGAEIHDVIKKLGGKIRVKYSLFIGDDKDVIHSISLGLSENSSAFDLMKLAEVSESKYKFLHTDVSGHIYVYDIAGIANDPEAGTFWQLYIGHTEADGSITHRNISPDKLILNDKEHFIMWYKTANTAE